MSIRLVLPLDKSKNHRTDRFFGTCLKDRSENFVTSTPDRPWISLNTLSPVTWGLINIGYKYVLLSAL